MDAALQVLKDRIVAAHHARTPLRIHGGGTKDFYGAEFKGEALDTRSHAGIVEYEPSELVLTARCGTSLSEIAATLAKHGQFLAFEPPSFAGDPTLGGIVAAGLSGPRRAQVGAVRDFVLGTTLLTAEGEVLRFGGQVMKNVAGFDVSRLLCGSLGMLGLITEVSIKVLPLPKEEITLRLAMSAAEALAAFGQWRGQPLPISAGCWVDGVTTLRLSGAPAALAAARTRIGGEPMAETDAAAWWDSLRNQEHPFFTNAPSLWRLSVPAITPLMAIPGPLAVEWNGALRWHATDLPADEVRQLTTAAGGTALQWRGAAVGDMFHPLSPVVLAIHRKLKDRFDPHGIFNPGRLVAGL
ncbi:MAG: glycolate oxidase subunit GlcE [Steroidobacteraceae bacterium]